MGEIAVKKWFILLLGLFILSGCSHHKPTISEERAAQVFVESVIYNKKQKDFIENFVDGRAILKEMEHSKDGEFSKGLITQMTEASAMSNQQAQQLTDALTNTLKQETNYKVKSVKKQKKHHYLVTYEIYGIDFVTALSNALQESYGKIANDASFFDDDEKIDELFFEQLLHQITQVGKVKKPTIVQLQIVQKEKMWEIPNSQAENIHALISAFWIGITDEEVMKESLSQAI